MKRSKFMNALSVLALSYGALLAATPANAEVISLGGREFIATSLGKVVKVVPAALDSRLTRSERNTAPDCETIAETISRREYLFDDCRENPSLSICKVFRRTLLMLAEGRDEASTPVDPRTEQAWTWGAPSAGSVDENALREAVAEKLGVSDARVEIVSATGARMSSEPRIDLDTDSLTRKVQSVLQMDPAFFGRLRGSEIVTKNQLVACDLIAGRARYSAESELELAHVDRVPENIVDAIWKGYVQLERSGTSGSDGPNALVNAAVVGYRLAVAIPPFDAGDYASIVHPAELFRRLYTTEAEGELRLRRFSSRQNLRVLAYPDQNYNARVRLAWRLL